MKQIGELKDAVAKRRLPGLCSEYRELCEQETAIKAAKKALMDDIAALAKKARVKKVEGEGWRIVKVRSGRSEIKAEKLLEQGVEIDVIEQATVKQEWTYYRVDAVR